MKRSASYQYISTMVHCREVKDECWIPIECNASAWKKLIDCGQGRSCWSGNGSKQMMTKAEAMGEWRTVYILWHRRRVNDTQFPGISVFMFCSGDRTLPNVLDVSFKQDNAKQDANRLCIKPIHPPVRSTSETANAHWMCHIDSSETSYKISCMFYFSSPWYDIWEKLAQRLVGFGFGT